VPCFRHERLHGLATSQLRRRILKKPSRLRPSRERARGGQPPPLPSAPSPRGLHERGPPSEPPCAPPWTDCGFVGRRQHTSPCYPHG
jgi:hypothetical protein